MSIIKKIRGFYISCQQELFPCVEQNYGVLPKRFRKLLLMCELVCVEDHLPRPRLRSVGRPLAHRVCLAGSFLAKMALNIPTTSGLRERLLSDVLLRSLCGWSRQCDVPSAATFSRAFQEFATAKLPTRIHEALIKQGYAGELVGHISRDSTEIEVQEQPVPKHHTSKPVSDASGGVRRRGRNVQGCLVAWSSS